MIPTSQLVECIAAGFEKFAESLKRLNRALTLAMAPDSVDGIYYRAMDEVARQSEEALERIDCILFSKEGQQFHGE
jgi:hypothetical protein